jgi:hypothetical protein
MSLADHWVAWVKGYNMAMRTYGRYLYNERLRHYGVLKLSTCERPKAELQILTTTETYNLPLLPGRRRQQLFPSPIQSTSRYNWGTYIRSGLGLRVDGDAGNDIAFYRLLTVNHMYDSFLPSLCICVVGEFMLNVNGTVHNPSQLSEWVYGSRGRAHDRTGLLPLGHADRLSHHARWEVRLRGAPTVQLENSRLLLFYYLPQPIYISKLDYENNSSTSSPNVDDNSNTVDDTMLVRRAVCNNCTASQTKSRQSSLAKGKLVQYRGELCLECPSCRVRLHPLVDDNATLPLEEIDGVVYLRYSSPAHQPLSTPSSSSSSTSTVHDASNNIGNSKSSSSDSESLGSFFAQRDTIHEDGLVAMVPLSGDGGITRIVDDNEMATQSPNQQQH